MAALRKNVGMLTGKHGLKRIEPLGVRLNDILYIKEDDGGLLVLCVILPLRLTKKSSVRG